MENIRVEVAKVRHSVHNIRMDAHTGPRVHIIV